MVETESPVMKDVKALVERDGAQKAAHALGITTRYLYMILQGEREISDNIARKFGWLRAPTQWVRIKPRTGLAVSADGKIHGDQIGEALAKLGRDN